jgi:endonuclease/exonuclease/phosphatase family metal-dependent hydrolase
MAAISLVSFNTHYGLCNRRDEIVPYDLAGVLRAMRADVMVIQELWRPDGQPGVVDEFAAEEGYDLQYAMTGRATRKTRWPHHDPNGEGTVGVGILTRVPARPLSDLTVGPTPGDPAPLRRLPQVELDGAGGPLRLVGVHLTSRLPHGHVLQLRRLGRLLGAVGSPTVVAGDCNFWGPPAAALLGGSWQRTVTGRTWPAAWPHSQLDHVMVRRGEVEATDAEVLEACGSDHRPVRVRLAW